MEKTLNKLFYSLPFSSSIGSIQKFHEKAQEFDDSITLENVKSYLSGKEGYTLHLVKPRKFTKRRFIVRKAGETVFADIVYLETLVGSKIYKFLLVLIDGFSKFVTTYPLKNLQARTIVPILAHFFENSIFYYRSIGSDRGVEFVAKPVQKLFKKN